MKKTDAVTEFLSDHLATCGKTQRNVAEAAGLNSSNLITMFKNGETKVPLDRAAVLARAVGADEAEFVCLVMRTYHPETWQALKPVMAADRYEQALLTVMRKSRRTGKD